MQAVMNVVTVGKDLIALLRDGTVLVIALLLLICPTVIKDRLVKSGVTKASIAGIEWNLVTSNQELNDVKSALVEYRGQMQQVGNELSEVGGQITDPQLRARIAQIEEQMRRYQVASANVVDSVAATIAANAPVVEKAQAAIDAVTTWGVVYGGDITLDAARYETGPDVAGKLGLSGATIYRRNGSYRSVVVAPTRAEADAVLAKARVRRADAYTVNMASWCPVSAQMDGYRECKS